MRSRSGGFPRAKSTSKGRCRSKARTAKCTLLDGLWKIVLAYQTKLTHEDVRGICKLAEQLKASGMRDKEVLESLRKLQPWRWKA